MGNLNIHLLIEIGLGLKHKIQLIILCIFLFTHNNLLTIFPHLQMPSLHKHPINPLQIPHKPKLKAANINILAYLLNPHLQPPNLNLITQIRKLHQMLKLKIVLEKVFLPIIVGDVVHHAFIY